ncbi:nucleotidyltransferase domain-containing protein [Anaerocolumna sp. MB42-C2]|uniref:nucleotidyltransferase domain-containing protein n=1 Tax=Anaerocolumna sp. MB42-C2 TaxID=3070997 RepID=UPI0027E12A52|nr:nucleotidyltransferase domain-containing protein [Anaerocolumna sp. MB42-C2]WMJ89699.1 nucleotidyltransferase domain-containing protein [Anaerocolumna sp. MB42-C2]
MQANLSEARNNLKNKLLANACVVISEIQKANLNNLLEIGLFGSLACNTFTCNSDADIYLVFDESIPDRTVKGMLRSIAEENNCDIVFINSSSLYKDNPDLLAAEILKNRIILWRKC